MPHLTSGARAIVHFRWTCHTCLQVDVPQHTLCGSATPAFRCTCNSTLQVNVPNLPLRCTCHLPSGDVVHLPSGARATAHFRWKCHTCLQVNIPHLPSGARATSHFKWTCHTCFQVHVPQYTSVERTTPAFRVHVPLAFKVHVIHLPLGARVIYLQVHLQLAFRCTCHLSSGACATFPFRCTCHHTCAGAASAIRCMHFAHLLLSAPVTPPRCKRYIYVLVHVHVPSGAHVTPSLRCTCHTCFKVCIAHLPTRATPDFSARVAPAFKGLCHISQLRCPWRTCLWVHVAQLPQCTVNTHATLKHAGHSRKSRRKMEEGM